MDEEKIQLPDLIWSCFINWLNTLEKAGDFQLINKKNADGNLKPETTQLFSLKLPYNKTPF